jgi:CheY-like chemotaxis protein
VLLIVENDPGFARFLLDAAREKGFKGVVTALGAAALTLTREYNPDAISLDIHLPDIDGWRVLDRLKKDPSTRHIPVCAISTDDSKDQALSIGCLAFVAKPIPSRDVLDDFLNYLNDYLAKTTRHLLVVEPDGIEREQIKARISDFELVVTAVPDTSAALRALKEQSIDCMVLGPGAEDLTDGLLATAEGAVKVEASAINTHLPVILFAEGSEPDSDGLASWRRMKEFCTVKRTSSTETLLDSIAFFLHRPLVKLPETQRQRIMEADQTNKVLARRKVLIVDDDMRNIFALSTILEEHDMAIASADNGRDAIRMLQVDPGVEIVLMDIMMPEMDGIETIRAIRQIPQLKNLPIVAVTAKAMKGDREKCIEAGAWDYLSKPVDPEQLLAVLRAWLHR